MAILPLGGTAINDITEDDTIEANMCNEFWGIRLREVLSEHTWNFAKVWVNLAEDASYEFIDGEYTYAYILPADYVRVSRMEDKDTQYEVRANYIVTNEGDETAFEYIALIEDVSKYPSWFVSALVGRLQVDLARPLSAKKSLSTDYYLEVYEKFILPKAKLRDAQEGKSSEDSMHRHTEENDSWLNARTY